MGQISIKFNLVFVLLTSKLGLVNLGLVNSIQVSFRLQKILRLLEYISKANLEHKGYRGSSPGEQKQFPWMRQPGGNTKKHHISNSPETVVEDIHAEWTV